MTPAVAAPVAAPPTAAPAGHGRVSAGHGRDASRSARAAYLTLLTWAFTFFNSVRVLAYLPTVWAIHASGDASQHSAWTWATWMGANATMAAWLYEQRGRRVDRAVCVNTCNAVMCAAVLLLIARYRL